MVPLLRQRTSPFGASASYRYCTTTYNLVLCTGYRVERIHRTRTSYRYWYPSTKLCEALHITYKDKKKIKHQCFYNSDSNKKSSSKVFVSKSILNLFLHIKCNYKNKTTFIQSYFHTFYKLYIF